MDNSLTTIEAKIYDLLKDGDWHIEQEIMACMPKAKSAVTAQVYAHKLNSKIAPYEKVVRKSDGTWGDRASRKAWFKLERYDDVVIFRPLGGGEH